MGLKNVLLYNNNNNNNNNNNIKAKDTKRITEFFFTTFWCLHDALSSEMIIQVDNLQNQSELT